MTLQNIEQTETTGELSSYDNVIKIKNTIHDVN